MCKSRQPPPASRASSRAGRASSRIQRRNDDRALVRLEIPRAAARRRVRAARVIRPDQTMFDFQLGTARLQPVVIVKRLDIPKCRRMNLVDRDVQMPVLGVLMDRRDALMFAEADRRADRVLDVFHLATRRFLAVGETDDEVIVLVGAGPRVPGLGRHDLLDRPAGILRRAVGHPRPRDFLAVMAGVQHVGVQPCPARRVVAAV